MPSFICEVCGAVDNSTSKNFYWHALANRFFIENPEPDKEKPFDYFEDDYYNTHLICSACVPSHCKNGREFNLRGWNGSYDRKHWSEYGREYLLNARITNAKEYFDLFDNGEVKESSRTKCW